MSAPFLPLQLFDADQEIDVVVRQLPHWSQPGTITFITWRTWDSIPKAVLEGWLAERARLLRRHGIDAQDVDWQAQLCRLERRTQLELRRVLSNRWNDHLDDCHGACVLRRPELSKIVADSLSYFDGDRYALTDYVVMPNHVHVLVAFPDGEALLDQCESWKRYTATRINRHLRIKGRFWQQDGFDHLVRTQEELEHLRRYIAENPAKARLGPDEFVHYSNPQL